MKKFGVVKSLQAWLEMIDNLREDIDRHAIMSPHHWFLVLLSSKGLWVTIQYRFSRWVHCHVHLPIIRQILKLLCFFWQKVMEAISGVELPNRANIGKGLYMPHANGIIVHLDATLGEHCNLSHQVTIGIGGRGAKHGSPTIGDRVFIGPGAKIFGAITIGNNVVIGANAVVTKDLPDNAVAVGIPARIISYQGSQDFVILSRRNSANFTRKAS
jgi:serine O-acetyltransferase